MSKIKDIKDWKELFETHILTRGYNYAQEDRVWDIGHENDVVSAVVAGTEDYLVSIRIKDKRITEMSCDCPYAADGSHCKHEAALLYALAEEDSGSDAKPPFIERLEAEREELWSLIRNMTEDELRKLLYDLASHDESLRNRIVAAYRESIDEKYLLQMKKMISGICCNHSDRSGYVDWRHAWDFISDLIGFLHENVQPLIERGLLREAFELTCEVFLAICYTDIDDDGDIAVGASECCDFWRRITSLATDDEQMRMYEWFTDHIGNGSIIDYMEDYLEDFRLSGFHSRPLLLKRLSDLDDMIARDEQNNRLDPTGWGVYKLGEHILSRVKTMKELDMQKEDVLKYIEKYTYLPRILLIYADEIYDSGDMEYAAAVLQKGKERDKEKPVVIREYSCKLIAFYEEQKLWDALVAELKYQIINCSQRDLHYINLLKRNVDEAEWLSFRENILQSEKDTDIRLELLKQEELLGRLMEEVKSRNSIAILDKYERDLRKLYGCEIRDIYADYVRSEMVRASSRNRYNHIIQDLRKIRRYEGGRELASDIAEKWKKEYPRRSAMLDELRKAGF